MTSENKSVDGDSLILIIVEVSCCDSDNTVLSGRDSEVSSEKNIL